MVRAFVAIDLSPELREKMRELQVAIRQSRARLNLVDPSIIHITIKFLGEIEATRVGPVSEALRGIRFSPFDLTITGLSTNNTRNPRVVWGTVGDRGQCRLLFEQVETALAALKFPREERGFTPHATIARVKEYDPSLMQSISPYLSEKLGECHISGFSLKKSTLMPAGPVYENIMEVTW
ncbi:MAG: RNA 2',3'-cyclic phosphodiesterase [Methanomicrobiales archaeon]